MQALPELSDQQQRILKVYDKLSSRYLESTANGIKTRRLTSQLMTHGFRNVIIGNIPDEIKEEARNWLQQAHNICKELGFDSTRMFSDEIVDVIVHHENEKISRSRERFDKARYKLARLALKENISALTIETTLIGSRFITHYEYTSGEMLYFTEADKQRLFDAKPGTVEDIIQALDTLPYYKWVKGYDSETDYSTLAEFLECAKLATWISISENEVYYYNKDLLDAGECVTCNSEPRPGDNWRSFKIGFRLCAGFEQDEDWGYPISTLSFAVTGGAYI